MPPPAQGCDAPYNGVTFTLTNQVASGVSPAVKFYFVPRPGPPLGLNIDGIAPVRYEPRVEISAPSHAKAQQFEVGFVSNCLKDIHEYTYSNGTHLRFTVPTPIKDGKSLSTNDYDPVYTAKSRAISYGGSGQKKWLTFLDMPNSSAYVYSRNNPECAGLPDGMLTDVRRQDSFRTWVVARHKASGCTRGLHHIDWNTDWRATVVMTGGTLSVTPAGEAIKVTTADGDGQPPFIQGGRVMNDLLATHRVCE